MYDHNHFLAKWGSNKHFDRFVGTSDWLLRSRLAQNHTLDEKQIEHLTKDEVALVRLRAAMNQNVKKEHLDKLIHDEFSTVREAVAKSPSSTKEHLDELSKDEDLSVRNTAKEQLEKRFPTNV